MYSNSKTRNDEQDDSNNVELGRVRQDIHGLRKMMADQAQLITSLRAEVESLRTENAMISLDPSNGNGLSSNKNMESLTQSLKEEIRLVRKQLAKELRSLRGGSSQNSSSNSIGGDATAVAIFSPQGSPELPKKKGRRVKSMNAAELR